MPYLTEVFAPVPLTESEPVVVYAKEYLEKVSDLITNTNKRSDSYYKISLDDAVKFIVRRGGCTRGR